MVKHASFREWFLIAWGADTHYWLHGETVLLEIMGLHTHYDNVVKAITKSGLTDTQAETIVTTINNAMNQNLSLYVRWGNSPEIEQVRVAVSYIVSS